mmetsp:Transcript_46247/g.41365  ORF Transcript_46247/g.41365 Transcript_46247/m.41365 type:complete len:496 (-) Transcript_46247:9-1496(-)
MSGAFEWKIENQLLRNMLKAQNGNSWESAAFTISNIPFKLKIYPNGNNKENIDSFIVCVKADPWPRGVKSMVVCSTIQCKQTMASITGVSTYTAYHTNKGIPNRTILLSEIKSMVHNLSCLNIVSSINILQINYSQTEVLYNAFNGINIKYKTKHSIVWKIDKPMLQSWKAAHYDKRYESHMVNNMWKIVCYPNGIIQDYQGYISVDILLCGLPPCKKELRAKFQIKCLETGTSCENTHRFDYQSPATGEQRFMRLSDINRYTSLTLTADIQIIDGAEQEQKSIDVEDDKQELHQDLKTLQNDNKTLLDRLTLLETYYTEKIVSLTQESAQLKEENQSLKTKMSTLTQSLMNSTMSIANVQSQQNKVATYLFDDENKNEDEEEITNITSKLLVMQKQMQSMQIEINQTKKPNINKENINPEQEKLRAWLRDTVKLKQYFDIFIDNGFGNLEAMQIVTMEVLNMIGIEKIGHKMILLRHIAKLGNGQQYEGSTAYI